MLNKSGPKIEPCFLMHMKYLLKERSGKKSSKPIIVDIYKSNTFGKFQLYRYKHNAENDNFLYEITPNQWSHGRSHFSKVNHVVHWRSCARHSYVVQWFSTLGMQWKIWCCCFWHANSNSLHASCLNAGYLVANRLLIVTHRFPYKTDSNGRSVGCFYVKFSLATCSGHDVAAQSRGKYVTLHFGGFTLPNLIAWGKPSGSWKTQRWPRPRTLCTGHLGMKTWTLNWFFS